MEMSGNYPPPGEKYPPPDGGYPNQQPPQMYPGYPPTADPATSYDQMKQPMPQPGSNPPPYQPTQGYPPAPGPQPATFAPPQMAPQPQMQQQSNTNVVVVGSQPTAVSSTVHVTRNDQSTFIFALIVTFILFFCGCWWGLFCTVPAMVVGNMASSAGGRGDMETKGKYDKISIILTVSAIVFQVVGFIVIVGAVAGVLVGAPAAAVSTITRTCSSFYSSSCRYG